MRAIRFPLVILSFSFFLLIGCNNNSSTRGPQATLQHPEPVAATTVSATAPRPVIDCGSLLSASQVASSCGLQGITERITSVEMKGRNCNRSYVVGKGWGAMLIFILTPAADEAGASRIFDRMKKDYSSKGLQAVTVAGAGASFTLNFTDNLSKRQMHQLVFRKNNYVVELKAEESRGKNPCPCYEMDRLQSLAAIIAAKL